MTLAWRLALLVLTALLLLPYRAPAPGLGELPGLAAARPATDHILRPQAPEIVGRSSLRSLGSTFSLGDGKRLALARQEPRPQDASPNARPARRADALAAGFHLRQTHRPRAPPV
jgi:hypothetical protein